jgi:ABC-type nitrate/sulfonate/bicarbonate transport system substrate-binding protein
MTTATAPTTLWYTRCGVPTPTGIAVQQGWIHDELQGEGFVIESLQDSARREVRQSHFDHTLENSFRQGGSVPAIWARSAGRDTRLLGLTWTDEYQGILTLPATGIRTVKELKGRRLALPRRPADVVDFTRAQALRGFLNALEVEGLAAQDVQFIDQGIDRSFVDDGSASVAGLGKATARVARRGGEFWAEARALIRGEVDAIFVKGSRGAELARFLGATLLVDIGRHPDPLVAANNHSPRTFTVDGHLLRTRPDVVARLLGRVLDAGQWAADHPEDTVAYIAREVGSIEPWVRHAYGEHLHQHLRTDLEESHIAALESFTAFLATHGFLAGAVDVRGWIDRAPLAEALRLRQHGGRSARAVA